MGVRQMHIHRAVATILTVSIFCLSLAMPTSAAPEGLCPAAGTAVHARNNLGDYTLIWHGADPTDATACVVIADGPGAALRGEQRYFLATDNLTLRPYLRGSEATAGAALVPLFTSQSNDASYDITRSMMGKNGARSETDIWHRQGRAALLIDGKILDTVVFQRTTRWSAGGFTTVYTANLWYDPAHHMFVKRAVTSVTGAWTPPLLDYEVLSISSPQQD
jgi:hypothetical protein